MWTKPIWRQTAVTINSHQQINALVLSVRMDTTGRTALRILIMAVVTIALPFIINCREVTRNGESRRVFCDTFGRLQLDIFAKGYREIAEDAEATLRRSELSLPGVFQFALASSLKLSPFCGAIYALGR